MQDTWLDPAGMLGWAQREPALVTAIPYDGEHNQPTPAGYAQDIRDVAAFFRKYP